MKWKHGAEPIQQFWFITVVVFATFAVFPQPLVVRKWICMFLGITGIITWKGALKWAQGTYSAIFLSDLTKSLVGAIQLALQRVDGILSQLSWPDLLDAVVNERLIVIEGCWVWGQDVSKKCWTAPPTCYHLNCQTINFIALMRIRLHSHDLTTALTGRPPLSGMRESRVTFAERNL